MDIPFLAGLASDERYFSKRYHELIFVARIGCNRYFLFMLRLVLLTSTLLLSCLLTGRIEAADTGDWGPWQEARLLYDSGKYQEALNALHPIPTNDASYHYNLGNIHYRLGQVGIAVAHLEKANREHPHDPDIQHNLTVARAALAKIIGEDKLDPASSWLETVADNAPLDEIRATLGLTAFVLSLFWILSYYRHRRLRKTLLSPAVALMLVAFLMTTGLYLAQRFAQSRPPAICLEPQVVRSGPGDHFLELARVETGGKLRLLAPSIQSGQDMWRQIRYSQDGVGWIKASSVLPL